MFTLCFTLILVMSLNKRKDIRAEWYDVNTPRIFFVFLIAGCFDLFLYYELIHYIVTH